MMRKAQVAVEARHMEESIRNIKNMKYSDVQALCFENGSLRNVPLFVEFIIRGSPIEVVKFMESSRKNGENVLSSIVANAEVLGILVTRIKQDAQVFDRMLIPLVDALPQYVNPASVQVLQQALREVKAR